MPLYSALGLWTASVVLAGGLSHAARATPIANVVQL